MLHAIDSSVDYEALTAQKSLLSEENLTLEKAIHVAQSLEAADKNTKKLKGEDA